MWICTVRGEEIGTSDGETEMASECWSKDDGNELTLADVEARMKRERNAMEELEVAEEVLRDDVPSESRIWTGRWCHREKGGEVRSLTLRKRGLGRRCLCMYTTMGLCASATRKSTLGATCSRNRRFQDGIHTHTTERKRTHTRGTTSSMGERRVVWKLCKALNGL